MQVNSSLFSDYPGIDELIENGDLPIGTIENLKILRRRYQNYVIQLNNRQFLRSNIVDFASKDYLQAKCDEDQLVKDFEEFLTELEKYINDVKGINCINPIKIMCVVLSMTTCEAMSLKNSSDTTANNLFKSLQIYNIHDISDYYRDNREEWIPYAHANHFELEDSQQDEVKTEESIRTIISNMINKFNNESNKPVELNFVTEEFFNSSYFRKELRKQGGIIIVDAVSLLHEKIKKVLMQSAVIGVEKISILAISPINPCNIQTNQILEDFIRNNLEDLYIDFREPFNRRCEIARGDYRTINTWFYSVLNEKKQPQATAGGRSSMDIRDLPEEKNISKLWRES
jgi:hypothetical protein